MCEFCGKEKTMMKKRVINPNQAAFCGDIKQEDILRFEYDVGVFLDQRGYLRLADLEDCNCIEAGERIKVNFCPVCGSQIKQSC